jgi:hypothetical protein
LINIIKERMFFVNIFPHKIKSPDQCRGFGLINHGT